MLYVGLSGGIGSGKSTVSARLAELGAVVIDADRIAREVVAPGTPGLAEIAERFGTGVLQPDGSLDRPALGAIVFADESARRDLEAITHPRVRDLTEERRAGAPRQSIVVHDVPLLVEAGLAPDHHLSVIVDSRESVRLDRLIRDRGMDRDTALSRISAQATDEQRYAVADVLVDNNGTREQLLAQLETLWRERLSPYNQNLLAARAVSRPSRVTIVDPDPDWPVRARRMIARIEHQVRAAPSVAPHVAGVDHIGSTSVAGLAAKDVIDLQVRLDDLAVADSAPFGGAMAAAGFVPTSGRRGVGGVDVDTVHPWAPDPMQWRKLTFGGCDPAQVVHVHVRQDGLAGAETALLFRDWLRANPLEREAYSAEKKRVAARHPGGSEQTRGDYPSAKEPWIAAALGRARRWQRSAREEPIR